MATRALLHDIVGWPHVEDAGSEPGWLIFGTGPGEMGVHPTHSMWEGREYNAPRHHEIALMCDDIEATRSELEAKGAMFSGPVTDEGYGLVTMPEFPEPICERLAPGRSYGTFESTSSLNRRTPTRLWVQVLTLSATTSTDRRNDTLPRHSGRRLVCTP